MNESPLVSILLNNYNYETYLPVAIDSVLNQDYANIELVVVDDGSTDESGQILNCYRDRIVSVLKENGGQGSAFNAGFYACRGDIICFVDADDYFLPGKVEKIVEIFNQNPKAEWIFHDLSDVDYQGCYLDIERPFFVDELTYSDLRQVVAHGGVLPDFPATSGLCFRRQLLARVLPIPEEIRISADNFLRLGAVHYAPGFLLPAALAAHRIHGKNFFEFSPDMEFCRAEANIKAAYYLRDRWPEMRRFTDRLFAHSVGRLAGKTDSQRVLKIPEAMRYLKNSPSPGSWLSCGVRVAYNYLKTIAKV